MSSIDAQIKALQLKKKKIDYVAYVVDLLKNDTKCVDFKDVKDEVVKKILPFLKELAEAIEKDSDVKAKTNLEELTAEETKALKSVAAKLLTKTETVPTVQNSPFNSEIPAATNNPAPKKIENMGDKMQFAMSNRHLANRRVQVINDEKVTIFGTVVGLDAPCVIVKTETGPTISVPLEKVVLS